MAIRRYSNWLRYKFKVRNRIMGLRFTTTWKCNSRCITCAIWKYKDDGKNDLTIEEIDTFSKAKYLQHVQYITLSGGEPTLRSDLPELIAVLHKNIPKATFGITTHGMNPDLEERVFRKILKVNPKIRFRLVGLSLNGPKHVHDKSRGIDGAWEKTIETYERLKNLVHCEFSFTFYKDNVEYFPWVRQFAKAKGTRAYICWTVMNDRFDTTEQDLVFWQPGMEKVFNEYILEDHLLPKNPLGKLASLFFPPQGVTLGCLYDHIINRRNMPCFAGSQIVHIDPEGNVFPCNFKLSDDRIIGNIRQTKFDDIWDRISPAILREIRQCECMYPNGLCGDSDIYPSIVNSPFFVLRWYLNKLLKDKPLVELLHDEKC
jgi:MoaA/NifB/PqqE/SkfB family radical SAM enzyme